MSKETEIAISVNVKEGPKTLPQTLKLPKDYCPANVRQAINEELVLTDECEAAKRGFIQFRIIPPTQVANPCKEGEEGTPLPSEKVTFVTIHADRHTFKDSCGTEKPGIWYYGASGEEEADETCGEYLDGPHVYISRRLQTIDFDRLHFRVCNEMFQCISAKEKKPVVINVTYGIGLDQNCGATQCTPCESGKVSGKKVLETSAV